MQSALDLKLALYFFIILVTPFLSITTVPFPTLLILMVRLLIGCIFLVGFCLQENIFTRWIFFEHASSMYLTLPFLFHCPYWHFKSRMSIICVFHEDLIYVIFSKPLMEIQSKPRQTITPLDISNHLSTQLFMINFFICLLANIQSTHNCLQPSWLELIFQLRSHDAVSNASLKSKYLSTLILFVFFFFFFSPLFSPFHLSVYSSFFQVLCARTSTAVPCSVILCVEHLCLPTSRSELLLCLRTIWLRVCRPWKRHLSPWLFAGWLRCKLRELQGCPD